jgi:hypothetical protein
MRRAEAEEPARATQFTAVQHCKPKLHAVIAMQDTAAKRMGQKFRAPG